MIEEQQWGKIVEMFLSGDREIIRLSMHLAMGLEATCNDLRRLESEAYWKYRRQDHNKENIRLYRFRRALTKVERKRIHERVYGKQTTI